MTRKFKTSFLLLGCALSSMSFGSAYAQDTAAAEEAQPEEERTLQTVQVRGEFIPEPQRATAQVASFLNPEDLARQGDANAALALTRLSGISIVGEKFAYVRGLGDRYSSALLNGAPLPSPEPLRRTVPLDLFPSNALSGATVQKTYSVQYPADFGGGVIDLKTLRQPNENFFNVKLGTGMNTESTLLHGLTVQGGDKDWFGFDDNTRDLPLGVSQALANDLRFEDLSDAQLEVIGQGFVTTPVAVIQERDNPGDVDFEVEVGRIVDFDSFEIGLVGVVGMSTSYTNQNASRTFVTASEVGDIISDRTLESFEVQKTTYNAVLNALGGVTFTAGDHEIAATGFYVHDTDSQAEIRVGQDFTEQDIGSGVIHEEFTAWYERQLIMGQLSGEHVFPDFLNGDFTFTWRGSLAESSREAPYERTLRRFIDDDDAGTVFYGSTNNYNINFGYLVDDSAGVGSMLKYETYFDGREAIFSAGFDYSGTEREYEAFPFTFIGGTDIIADADARAARPDFLFSNRNIFAAPGGFEVQEVVTADSYDASLDILAGFAEADVEFTDYIRVTGGLRYEEAREKVVSGNRFGDEASITSTSLSNDYVLPALSLTWNFADDLQFRLAYSETIARPQFRELAASSFIDPETGRTFIGNAALVDSEFKNYDARVEYYMGRNEFITGALFFKEITNPIEEVLFQPDGDNFNTGYINSPKAELFGAELEYKTRFDFPLDYGFLNDREGLFSVNYTYTASEVVVDDPNALIADPARLGQFRTAASFSLDGSDLQGTPENILNFQFGWESDVEQMTLLIGWVDQRILQRGSQLGFASVPDIIEDPGVQLDIVYNRDFNLFGQDMTLGLSGRNLLDEQHEEFQTTEASGRTEVNTYDRGMSLSASVTAKF